MSFLYDEYDGSELFERRELEQHLDTCESCAAEVAALSGVRQQLREWAAPESLSLGFRVVRQPAATRRWWTGGVPFPLAAAAALVLGVGLGMARLDVQYDANGLRIRTGWGHDATSGGAPVAGRAGSSQTAGTLTDATASAFRPSAVEASAVRTVAAATLGAPSGASAAGVPALVAPAKDAPWRGELAALERQMRQELAVIRQSAQARSGGQVQAASVLAGDPAGRSGDAALIQRIQQMVDQSELRQQQNLALRMAELSRDFDMQRRSDLVRVEQSFGRLNDQREQDAQQQRLLLNAIRVSQQRPQ